jgi:hypothetical protein
MFTTAIPDSVRQVPGVRVTIIAVQGGNTDLAAGDSIIAVPWQYDEVCDFEVWGEREWVPEGADAVFTISDFREHEGVLVSDQLGWHSPYPQGAFLEYEARQARPVDRSEWLTPREYYDMVLALPALDSTSSRAERAREIERVIENGNPQWRARFPGNELLRRVRSHSSN